MAGWKPTNQSYQYKMNGLNSPIKTELFPQWHTK